jgi:lactoylglutathione lyase
MTSFHDAFPILYVDDVARAVAFYEETMGLETTFRWPEDGELEFAFLRLEPLGVGIAARPASEALNPACTFELCVYTDDVDAAAERLRAAGAELVRAPADEPWRERRAYLRDLDGHLVHLCARLPE